MHTQTAAGITQHDRHVVLQNVVPQPEERACAVVHDEDAILSQQPVNQSIN